MGIVALTRGEMGTRGGPADRAGEFDEAAAILGLAAHDMLDIPDARVEVELENKLKIVERIRFHKPRLVFAPYWVDRHPDHEKTSQLVREAVFLAGLKKVETGQDPTRPYKLIFFLPHPLRLQPLVHRRHLCPVRAEDRGCPGLPAATQFGAVGAGSPRPPRHSSAGRSSWTGSRPGPANTAPRSASGTASRSWSGRRSGSTIRWLFSDLSTYGPSHENRNRLLSDPRRERGGRFGAGHRAGRPGARDPYRQLRHAASGCRPSTRTSSCTRSRSRPIRCSSTRPTSWA